MVHHGIDRDFQLENFPSHIHGDLARQVAARHGGRHIGDVAHLGREIGGHGVNVIGEIFPRSGYAAHLSLPTQLALGSDFPGHAGDFGGEGIELIHHGVNGLLQLENLASHIHGDLARKIAACDGGCNVGDIAHLRREIAGHLIDALGEVFPHAGNSFHPRLSA